MLVGIGWIGTMMMNNTALTIGNQVKLSGNKVLTLEVQKDIAAMRIDMRDSRSRIGKLEADSSKHESAISYLGKQHGL